VPSFELIPANQSGAESWPITAGTLSPDPVATAEALKVFAWAYDKGDKMAEEIKTTFHGQARGRFSPFSNLRRRPLLDCYPKADVALIDASPTALVGGSRILLPSRMPGAMLALSLHWDPSISGPGAG
jgi:hypothetical protein